MGITNSNKQINMTQIDCGGTLKVTLALSAAPDIAANPTDIVLVLDRSGSMAGTPLANMKLGADTFIDIIDEATDSSQDGNIGSGSRIGIVRVQKGNKGRRIVSHWGCAAYAFQYGLAFRQYPREPDSRISPSHRLDSRSGISISCRVPCRDCKELGCGARRSVQGGGGFRPGRFVISGRGRTGQTGFHPVCQ